MTDYVVSTAFVDDVARFGGTASQIARLRARSGTRAEPPRGASGSPPGDRRLDSPSGRRRPWDRFLLWLAGVDYELASRSYVDRARYTTVGLAVLVTAMAAGVSFFLVVSSAGVATVASALVSVPWTALIVTLERSLAASATRRLGSVGGAVVLTAVRVVIAVLIAVVIAQPLMLRLFQAEIENQIQTTRLNESQAFTSQQYDSPLVRDLQAQLRIAQDKVNQAQESLNQAQAAAGCEINGTCGSNTAGIGITAQERLAEVRQAQAEYDAERSHYQAALAQIQQSTAELNARPVGLLEQFQAFSEVASRDPSVAVASTIVVVLFVTVETLPVLLVVLARRRGRTLYEQLLAIHERYAQDEFEVEAVRAAGARLTDDSDPEVDDLLRRFEQQRDEIGQITQATLATVIQLREEREARRRTG